MTRIVNALNFNKKLDLTVQYSDDLTVTIPSYKVMYDHSKMSYTVTYQIPDILYEQLLKNS